MINEVNMRLAWATDIHLNFLDDRERRQFLESLRGQADALVVTGDIAESNSLDEVLGQIGDVLEMPVYFVLGNHDFYRGSIRKTRAEVVQLAAESERLVYLPAGGVVELSPQTTLVGHDGWADGQLGDFWGSKVFLNDFVAIRELRLWKDEFTLDKPALRRMLHQLGDEAAQYLLTMLPEAAEQYP